MSQETLRIPQILFTSKAYTIDLIIPTKNEAMLKARKNIEALVERVEKKSATKSTVFFEKYYPKISNCENYSVSMMPPNGSVVLKTDNLTIKDIEGDDSVKR